MKLDYMYICTTVTIMITALITLGHLKLHRAWGHLHRNLEQKHTQSFPIHMKWSGHTVSDLHHVSVVSEQQECNPDCIADDSRWC